MSPPEATTAGTEGPDCCCGARQAVPNTVAKNRVSASFQEMTRIDYSLKRGPLMARLSSCLGTPSPLDQARLEIRQRIQTGHCRRSAVRLETARQPPAQWLSQSNFLVTLR